MAYKDWSDERKAEYKRRIEKIKKANPDAFYPSSYHKTMKGVFLLAAFAMWKEDLAYKRALFPFVCWSFKPYHRTRKFAQEALIHAAALGNKEVCKNIHKDFETDINAKDKKGKTALMKSVERKRLQVAQWLLEKGAKILPRKDGWNPIFEACYKGCIPALNMFLYYGVDFNQPYSHWSWKKGIPHKEYHYPIEVALVSQHPNVAKTVQWLLDHGVSIDNNSKDRPSILTILKTNPDVFRPEIQEILTRASLQRSEPVQSVKKTLLIKNRKPQRVRL